MWFHHATTGTHTILFLPTTVTHPTGMSDMSWSSRTVLLLGHVDMASAMSLVVVLLTVLRPSTMTCPPGVMVDRDSYILLNT